MLQIDHIYEFFYKTVFQKQFDLYSLPNGVPKLDSCNIDDINVFTPGYTTTEKIFFYDQEPLLESLTTDYLNMFNFPRGYTLDKLSKMNQNDSYPYGLPVETPEDMDFLLDNPNCFYKTPILATSEKSKLVDNYVKIYRFYSLYYFFHGFAALDWYRGFYALNYSKPVNKKYSHNYVSYNRIINHDRSYRIYWVSKLAELGLMRQGQVSFNVTDNLVDDWRDEVASPNTKLSEHARRHAEQYLLGINKLVIDGAELPGSASADIPREVDALWNIVTETVFYYDKLHLTEKIFKPIVSKQPFMLLAAPGNLAYLKSYGFKTFDGIIDESYDNIVDNDARIDAVAAQLAWYCNLSQEEKQRVIERLTPIVEYNFQHFYGEFKHIITRELLDNCKALFKEIGYDDSAIAYETIYKVLTS